MGDFWKTKWEKNRRTTNNRHFMVINRKHHKEKPGS